MNHRSSDTKLLKGVWLKTQTKVVLLAQRLDATPDYRINITGHQGEITSITTYVKESGRWYERKVNGPMKSLTRAFLEQKYGDAPPPAHTTPDYDALSEEMITHLFKQEGYSPCNTPAPEHE